MPNNFSQLYVNDISLTYYYNDIKYGKNLVDLLDGLIFGNNIYQ